jgi:flagellar biosynthesis/type III secretory pathway M-ring protein FliF/YscJ
MTIFTLIIIFALWMILRSTQPKKNIIRPKKKVLPKKNSARKNIKKAVFPNAEQKQKIATELLKKDPEVVSQVIKKWLLENEA